MAARAWAYARSEFLAEEVIGGLEAGMLCSDRHFYGFELYPVDPLRAKRLRDGSYLNRVRAAAPAQRGRAGAGGGVPPGGSQESEPPGDGNYRSLAALYHERCETAFDESHLRGARMVLAARRRSWSSRSSSACCWRTMLPFR